MPKNLTLLKVFIASPGGLAEERKAFRDVLQEYNEAEAIPRGVYFQPIGWEDTLGGVGRPQAIINEDIRDCDYFVLLLWNRWGSSPSVEGSRYTSATEEEYHVALECYERKSMRRLVLMFKAVDPLQLSDAGPQLQKVLDFRKQIDNQKTHLFHTFDTAEHLQRLLRKHLADWLRGEERSGGEDAAGGDRDEPPVAAFSEPGDTKAAAETPAPAELPESATSKAWALADEGRVTEAEVEFAKAIVGRQRPQPLIEYGRFLARLGRLDQATVLFEGAIRIAEEQKDDQAVAVAYGRLGSVLRTRGDLDGAERMHRKALEIEERLGRSEGVANAYSNLGNVLRIRGDLDGAEQMYRKALEINGRLGRLEGMANAYGNLGNVLHARNDLDGAEQMHRKALEIDERLGRSEGVANAYGNLGNVLKIRGDLDQAEQMYRKALKIDERLGRLEGVARVYGNLGVVLHARGDLDGAEQMHRKALEIDVRLDRPEGMASAYENLGDVLKTRGDLEAAGQMYRKALEVVERLGAAPLIANIKSLLSSLPSRGATP